MKILAVILSFYVLILTTMPCDDAAFLCEKSGVALTTEHHSHHTDSCSPFCICQCCQAYFEITVSTELSFCLKMMPNYGRYILLYDHSEPSDFLIPPEAI